jgi:succinoglycan biosynthesis protein ExoA
MFQNPNARIRVSVIMPVLNEERFIKATLRSVQAQCAPDFQLEILVIDGMSEDSTRKIVTAIAAQDPRIRLLNNRLRHTPAALNLGLRAATGEYVCIMGAHASYKSDYISVCLQELRASGAVGCSGKVLTTPADSTLQARLIAWAVGHAFASSSRSVRTQPEGCVDAVPFPLMRKQALLDAGGYNEQLIRNQDNDMNQRLRARGSKLYVTGKTHCHYYPKANITSFLKYGFVSGLWNVHSLKKNAASMSPRHFAPSALVAVLLLLAASILTNAAADAAYPKMAGLALGIILSVHLVLGLTAGVQVGIREKTLSALWLAPLILAYHCSYGFGTLRGLLFPSRA